MNMVEVRCNLCGSDNYRVIYRPSITDTPPSVEDYTSTINRYGCFHRIVSCRSCGFIYMNPRDARVKELYGEVKDDAYISSWDERAGTFREHLKILQRYALKGGNLLDIGCYAGIFPDEAVKDGYEVTAIEPSIWASEYAARKTKAKILCGSWDEVSLPQDHFDIVTMWDVIEHLEDPSSCLGHIHKLLKTGGIVAVTTHDIKGIFARLAGGRYPWLMRFHLYHFEPKTLRAMLLKNGLEPILTRFYVKRFTLQYFLSRFGIKTTHPLFRKMCISLYSGDMLMVLARKKSV
jgi:2-polyprenyl-3-methyl-5-hydroxy-6-metoxy-1,4-benzoquinol methylase